MIQQEWPAACYARLMVEGNAMLAILRQKLRDGQQAPVAAFENGHQMVFYLGTHGITMLLLIVLLLGVILLD